MNDLTPEEVTKMRAALKVCIEAAETIVDPAFVTEARKALHHLAPRKRPMTRELKVVSSARP